MKLPFALDVAAVLSGAVVPVVRSAVLVLAPLLVGFALRSVGM
jgi:hypothetical protein